MIRKLFNRWVRKSGITRADEWLKGALGGDDTASGVRVTPDNALGSSTVTACVRLLSESVASLPLHVYRRSERGKERAADHPLYRLLHNRPNPYMTSYTWRAHMMVSVLLHGNAYSALERDPAGRVVALWPLDSRHVQVKSEDGAIYYELRTAGERRRLEYDEVLHIKGPSMDGITGMGIIKLARHGIGLDLAMSQYSGSLFKNNGIPYAYVTSPNVLNDKSRKNFLDYFRKNFGGIDNAGKIAILDEGLEIKTVSFSPEDAQFLESRQFTVQDICRWFKVNPHLVGDPSRLAYASSEAEFNAYLVHSLAPWLRNIESEMCVTLLPDDDSMLIEFDPNGMARGSQAERYAAYEKGLSGPNPWLTVADVRAAENLPYIEGTDRLPTKEVQRAAA